VDTSPSRRLAFTDPDTYVGATPQLVTYLEGSEEIN